MAGDSDARTGQGSGQASPSTAAWRACLAALVLVSLALAWHGARRQSLTWDEPVFIVAGLSYWQTGDHRLNAEAPPLGQLLVALPLLALDLRWPDYASPGFAAANQVGFAIDFMRANATQVEDIGRWTRVPIWLVSALGVWLAGQWGRALYGVRGGLAAAILVAFTPTLIAHGRLATTDQLCATAMLAAGYCLWRALGEPRRRWWCAWGLACAVAVTAKFTGLLLLPVAALQLVFDPRGRRLPLPVLATGLALAVLVGLAVVGGVYGRPFDPRPFLAGLGKLYTNINPDYRTYVLGTVHAQGVWYAYLLAWVLKTPLPALLFTGAALLGAARLPAARQHALWLLLPAVTMFAVACFDSVNVGLRRVLPALAPLAIYSARLAHARLTRGGGAVIAGLLLWLVLEVLVYHPAELSYFNQLAGGPSRAPWLLDDSNIDWGQDLPALARWQAAHAPGEPLALSYFGTMPPELYGVRARPMQEADYRAPAPGLYALSTHRLVWLRKIEAFTHAGVDWLTRYEPTARIGYAIYVYRFPQPGAAPAAR